MTLVEADQWFESYKAFISYNKRSMTKMDISVKNKCLDTKLLSALRTHKDVTYTTEIDALSTGCLAKLLEIFLEKNLYGLGDTGTSSVLKLNLRLSKSGGPENWTKPGNAGSTRSPQMKLP